jgi:hypothetical protein
MELSWVDFFPIVFFPFKLIVLGVGMFFAIKWHYDQDKKQQQEAAEAKQPPVQHP